MVENTFLIILIKFELLVSLALVTGLLVYGVSKKNQILSETARIRLTNNWSAFRTIFLLAFITMGTFLAILILEFIEIEQGAVFRSIYPSQTRFIELILINLLIITSILNFRLVNSMVGGKE